MAGWARAEDLIELLSGAKVQGTLSRIDKTKREVTFEALIGSKKYTRTYPYSKIHAVTWNGTRYVINEKTAAPAVPSPGPAESGTAPARGSGSSTSDNSGSGRRTNAQIDALINEAGRTPPEWFDDTPLNPPQSLDLSWPEKPPSGWDAQRNVGQYIWDIINPNPNRWREGVRLMHHLLSLHKDNPAVSVRVMKSLGGMHFRFFQDYARTAFWLRQAGVAAADPDAIKLAECYWRLGNKQMAVQLLNQPTLSVGMIKLWGDMGDTDKAVAVAETYVRVRGEPHPAYLAAGDACRLAGRTQAAMAYYDKVLQTPPWPNREKPVQGWRQRARENMEAIRLFERAEVRTVADGVYTNQSTGYAGAVQVEVTVSGGRLESVRVTNHQEKQFYSAMTDTPRQLVEKQGVKGVDAFSGATITAEAIINATAKALANAPRR
jgi:uncharacterized protein with FMN-binding domain